jgi:hypothetical protein
VTQQVALVVLMWCLTTDAAAASPLNICLVVALQVGFLAGSLHLPRRLWPLLLLCNGALTRASNAAQIMLTFRSKSTGQLSWITIGLRLAGTMVRMFTTLVLTDKDMTLFFLFAMGAALALAQAVQLTIYS